MIDNLEQAFEKVLASATWQHSSRSPQTAVCVEVAVVKMVVVRDSKNPDGPGLLFTDAEWEAFADGAKDGEFDL